MAHRIIQWALVVLLMAAVMPVMADGPEERIAFQRNDPPAITVMFLDGSGAVDMAPSRKFTDPCITPALSPDGRTLVFAAKVEASFKLFSWRLDERNAVVGEPKRLTTQQADVSESFPCWSPDGKRLAFLATDAAKKMTLRVINADGSGMVQLTGVNHQATPTWSIDGQQLLYIDLIAGKTVLHNIPASGGKGLPIRPESRIIAACYSPDGKQIAALVEKENGASSDLYLLPPFGIGGRAVVRNIVGGKSVSWRHEETITFNASHVGEQGGKAFWLITPEGKGLRGLTGYADPKQVAYFSIQTCDLTPYVPTAVDPNTRTDVAVTPLPDYPLEEERVEDMTDILAAHAVTILSPTDDVTLQGIAPINIITRKNVAAVAILINGEFAYKVSTATAQSPVPRITYDWNTQEFKPLNLEDGLPASYQEALRYPDGHYTLCAQALDGGNKLIDQHIITVIVKNELSGTALPGGVANLRYRFTEKSPSEFYRLRIEGTLYGAQPQQATELNATLDVALRRMLVKALPDGGFGFRIDARGPSSRNALSYGRYQGNIPEFAAVGAYSLTLQGDLRVPTSGNYKPYLPISQLSVPFPDAPAKVGQSWSQPMWVVLDVLNREAAQVKATHRFDGIEWMNGRRMARIRSDFRLDSGAILYLQPNPTVPGELGARAAVAAINTAQQATGKQQPGVKTPAMNTVPSISARETTGVRYAWFDLEEQKLLRVEDTILHAIPAANLPTSATTNKTTQPAGAFTAWYVVRYLYSVMDDPQAKK